MTDKIDGKECRYWFRPTPGDYRKCALRGKDDNCDEINDCFIKELLGKLAQKDEECKRLKEEIKTNGFGCFNIEMSEQLDQLKAENEKMSRGYAELTEIVSPYIDDFTGYNEKLGGFDIVLCVKELLQQLNSLKAQNDTYKKMLEDEEVRFALNEVRTGERHLWFNRAEKLEQTLIEIKDIAENVIKNVSNKCIEITPMYGVHKQILQKISKVEE